MLKGESKNGEDRDGDADDKSRRNPPPANGDARGARMRGVAGLGGPASERRSEAKRPFPAQCFNWPHFE